MWLRLEEMLFIIYTAKLMLLPSDVLAWYIQPTTRFLVASIWKREGKISYVIVNSIYKIKCVLKICLVNIMPSAHAQTASLVNIL